MASQIVFNTITGQILQSVIYDNPFNISMSDETLNYILNSYNIPEKERKNYKIIKVEDNFITGEARIIFKYENNQLIKKKLVSLMLIDKFPTEIKYKCINENRELIIDSIILTVDGEDYIIQNGEFSLESPVPTKFEVSITRDKNYFMFPTIIEVGE
ncbi:MAG: hypothetical protein KatS3mg002_0319 [Candidatus Woesearchaeota archaeon]|nr:MAG: hypothetical protein KatS3mg002_0319 [Candidatus Woesearchaeota archaeon]